MPRRLTRAQARQMSHLRKTHGAGSGRPRLHVKRCGCGVMTLKRAKARGKSFEHDPSCVFYRERVIVI
jgi:hypothetical protein